MKSIIIILISLSFSLLSNPVSERRIEICNEYNAELDSLLSVDIAKATKSAITGSIAASPCKRPEIIVATGVCAAAISIIDDSYSHYETMRDLTEEYHSLDSQMSENLQRLNNPGPYISDPGYDYSYLN